MMRTASTEALSLRRIAAALRPTTLLPSFPTLESASKQLFMATMEFYHQHRDLVMPARLTATLALLRQAKTHEDQLRRAVLAYDLILDDAAGGDPTVLLALARTSMVVTAEMVRR